MTIEIPNIINNHSTEKTQYYHFKNKNVKKINEIIIFNLINM